jgi:adenylate cyclase class IV
MMRSRQLAGGESRHLVMDGTGVGPAVVDLLRREDLQSKLWAVTITGVDTERFADGYYRVPKRDLIVGLQVLMQQDGLQIAAGMKGATLVKEMAEIRVEISASGNEQ